MTEEGGGAFRLKIEWHVAEKGCQYQCTTPLCGSNNAKYLVAEEIDRLSKIRLGECSNAKQEKEFDCSGYGFGHYVDGCWWGGGYYTW